MKEFVKRWNWDTHKTRFLPPLREFILGNENYNEQWDMSNKIHSSEQTKHKMSSLSYSLSVRDIVVDKMDILSTSKDL